MRNSAETEQDIFYNLQTLYMQQPIQAFIAAFKKSFDDQRLIRLGIMNKRDKLNEINSVSVKLIQVREGLKACFVYRYPTKDVTKNYFLEESLSVLEQLIVCNFYQADLYTSEGDFHLSIQSDNKAKLKKKEPTLHAVPSIEHNKKKNRLLNADSESYLFDLGISDKDGQIKTSMQFKYKQINKYIEIIDSLLKQIDTSKVLKIVDMGSGKGYLTFALYDYLVNTKKIPTNISGIELRNELVEQCNSIASKHNFEQLHFSKGNIKEAEVAKADIFIALHACDTATDDAIYKGIQAKAKVIICAPCCHKQIRKAMLSTKGFAFINQHGILKERQAEILTDTIRALVLESNGYQTKVFEFIDTEHTPKNIMITAIKRKKSTKSQDDFVSQIQEIKENFGIANHYLQDLMEPEKALLISE